MIVQNSIILAFESEVRSYGESMPTIPSVMIKLTRGILIFYRVFEVPRLLKSP